MGDFVTAKKLLFKFKRFEFFRRRFLRQPEAGQPLAEIRLWRRVYLGFRI